MAVQRPPLIYWQRSQVNITKNKISERNLKRDPQKLLSQYKLASIPELKVPLENICQPGLCTALTKGQNCHPTAFHFQEQDRDINLPHKWNHGKQVKILKGAHQLGK